MRLSIPTTLSVLITATLLCSVANKSHAVDVEWTALRPHNTNAATDTANDLRDYYADVATDGNGTVISVWCTGMGSGGDRDFDIMFSRSTDFGQTWSAPARLDPFAQGSPEAEDDFHPEIRFEGNGRWIAYWYSHDSHGGTIGDDTDVLISRSEDNGVTWTSSVPWNADAATDDIDYPDGDSDGTPTIAYDGNGTWVGIQSKILGSPFDATDLYISHSTDHGVTWTQLTPLFGSSDNWDETPFVTSDGNGNFVLVWSSDDPIAGTGGDNNIFVSTSSNGTDWTAPQILYADASSNGLNDNAPHLATDKNGRWVAVWSHGHYDAEYEIYMSYSDDNGATWSPATYINHYAPYDYDKDLSPRIAADGNGGWMAVWESKFAIVPAAGPDDDIFYAYSSDNAATWTDAWVLNSYGVSYMEFQDDRDAVIIHLGNGRWQAIWGSKFDLNGIGTDYDLIMAEARVPVIDGDSDCDGDVDLSDFAALQSCFAGSVPVPSGCALFDFDIDDDIDTNDYQQFESNLVGP